MTVTQLKNAITQIVKSIKENGDFELLKSYVDPDGTMTDEEAFKQSVEEFSSKEVLNYVQDNYSTIPSEFSFAAIEFNNMEYFILGSEYNTTIGDGTMHYAFIDQYCITSNGELFRNKVLEVSNDQLMYVNTLILQIELYNYDNSDWYFRLDTLTSSKESPLHEKYDGFLEC